MTVLGGVSPKFKGEDDLTKDISDFHDTYNKYMTAYNKYIGYLLDEKELIRARDSEGLVTVRHIAMMAIGQTDQHRAETRKAWAQLKKTWRRFNRGKML